MILHHAIVPLKRLTTEVRKFTSESISKAGHPSSTNSSKATTSTSTNGSNDSNGTGIYGRLWGRGYEELQDRQLVHVVGPGATKYLQNLITSNLMSSTIPTIPTPETIGGSTTDTTTTTATPVPVVQFNPQLRSTCFLDPKGRIITDALLWKINEDEYYIDAPNTVGETLLQHLQQYKLRRSEVTITSYDTSNNTTTTNNKSNPIVMASHVIYGTLDSGANGPPGYVAGLDPRHPSLGLRILQLPEAQHNGLPPLSEIISSQFARTATPVSSSSFTTETDPNNESGMQGNYALLRRLAGIAEGKELSGRIALESNQELLNAVSFDKGCYLGQELTARVFHTGVIRKRILPLLLLDAKSIVPQPWIVASQLQERRLQKRYTAQELQALPSRLPRLSVAAAGQLVAITTASIEPSNPSIDQDAAQELINAQEKVTKWLNDEVEVACQLNDSNEGAKILDTETGTTIGQIVAPPVKGTNLILALMRLESVGLIQGGTWSKTNKITINGKQFRYLPYLPLWWPELSIATGKAKRDDEDYSIEARISNSESDEMSNDGSESTIPPGMVRMSIEEIHDDVESVTATAPEPSKSVSVS
jgi:transferase CAF17, mitochondrial